jgi:hypothetical protein
MRSFCAAPLFSISAVALGALVACQRDESEPRDHGTRDRGGTDRGLTDATNRDAMVRPDASADAQPTDAAALDAAMALDQQPLTLDAATRDMADQPRPDLGLDCSPCRGMCRGESLACMVSPGCYESCDDVGDRPCVPRENGVQSCDESSGTDVRVLQWRGCENNHRVEQPEATCDACRGQCDGTCIVYPCTSTWGESCSVGYELQLLLEGCPERTRCECLRSILGEGQCHELGGQRRVFVLDCP